MGIEYSKVLQALNVDYSVFGRGINSIENSKFQTGQKAIDRLGYDERWFEVWNSNRCSEH